MALSCLTPLGQVTIPRSILKLLGIKAGSFLIIEIENDQIIFRKMEKSSEDDASPIYKAV